jgi:hypothetical protein
LEAVQTLPAGTELFIQGEHGSSAKGLLQSVEDAQLTIVKDKDTRVYPIERRRISRVQVRKRDPLWNGMVIGFLAAAASHAAYGNGWSNRERVWNYAGNVGFCALLDLSHTAKRTVYRAP